MDVHPTAVMLFQSLLFLLQPLKQAPAGLPAPSSRGRLCCRVGSPPHRTPLAGLAIPLLTHTCCYSPATADEPINPRTVVLPSTWETTAESSLPLCRSLPRPRRRPLPWCSRRAMVNVVNKEIHRTWTLRVEADSWVHDRTQGNASLLRAK